MSSHTTAIKLVPALFKFSQMTNYIIGGKTMTQQAAEQINTSENGVYIVQDGIITPLKPKPFGQDTIIWHNGQVLDVERAERIRIKKTK